MACMEWSAFWVGFRGMISGRRLGQRHGGECASLFTTAINSCLQYLLTDCISVVRCVI